MMKRRYRVGDKVRLTQDALDNYECDNKVYIIESVSTKYMTAKEFYSKGMPDGYHPGYDEGVNEALYDLVGFNNSLYDYELK